MITIGVLVFAAYLALIKLILALVRINPPTCTGNCNQGRATCDCQGNKDA